ncbi:MAG TPA: amidase [Bryobacteraceae bacterium]|nr:amidase [Bryobacteraceae bacterium]
MSFTRRSLLSSAALAAAAWAAPPVLELEEATAGELAKRMAAGSLTAHALTAQYLNRIAAIDQRGPKINSVIELNPDALAIASALDAERKAKGARGTLHGLPVLIKDNIDTADKMMTTAGSLALFGSIASKDSVVAQRLRAAGAVILGKTNLSEWANYRSSHSTSGWSGRGGLTLNPYALDRNACGSSSGSGAAVSANLCALAIGTETDGSIVCPSSLNGVVGIKPTLGRIPATGIIPIAHSQDTAGPMARTVTDAALLLGALTGGDYTSSLDTNGLRGARIGVAREKFFGFNEESDRVIEAAIAEMKRAGAEIIDPADITTAGQFDDSESIVLSYEFKNDLNLYLGALGPRARVHSLADVIAFNDSHRDEEMPYFGQDIMIKAQSRGPLSSKEYVDALEKDHKLSRAEGIDATLAKYRLDALVAPTAGPAWCTDLINGDHVPGGSSTPAAVAGYPNINVPAGFVHGLPVGISFFSTANSEARLIRLAYAFEQATRQRRPPRFLPHAI